MRRTPLTITPRRQLSRCACLGKWSAKWVTLAVDECIELLSAAAFEVCLVDQIQSFHADARQTFWESPCAPCMGKIVCQLLWLWEILATVRVFINEGEHQTPRERKVWGQSLQWGSAKSPSSEDHRGWSRLRHSEAGTVTFIINQSINLYFRHTAHKRVEKTDRKYLQRIHIYKTSD